MQQQATESYHCCGSRSSSCCCCGFAPPCSPPPAPCPSSSSSCFPPLLPTLFPPLLHSLFFSSCRCFLSLLPLLLLTPSLPRSPSLLLAPPFIPPSPPGSANHTQPRETRKIQATWPGPERPRGPAYVWNLSGAFLAPLGALPGRMISLGPRLQRYHTRRLKMNTCGALLGSSWSPQKSS